MKADVLFRLLVRRQVLAWRETWSRDDLLLHQYRALDRARRYAASTSTYYRRLHRGLEDAPLHELPVVTRSMLMSAFDEAVTDDSLEMGSITSRLATLDYDETLDGRWHVCRSTNNEQTVVARGASEWAALVASYARALEWAGVGPNLRRPTTLAVVAPRQPWHQSARVAQALTSPLVRVHRVDAALPLHLLVAGLNRLAPQSLVASASMLAVLAGEQLQGRLRLRPQAVISTGELLTADTRALARDAWGQQPFDLYATTETGPIAAECREHRGLHLFEDELVVEPVDLSGMPVPSGTTADRLLVTSLSPGSLPLVRYELPDRVRLSREPCPCGRPFRLIEAIEERQGIVPAPRPAPRERRRAPLPEYALSV